MITYPLQAFKSTQDEWYPNCDGNTVCVRINKVKNCKVYTGQDSFWEDSWVVSVFGNDDCGCNRLFWDEHSALDLYHDLLSRAQVNKQTCDDLLMDWF